MSDQGELRDRIATVLSDHRIEATGPGEVSCVCEHEWRPTYSYRNHLAQAIIDEFGLRQQTVEGVMSPDGDYDAQRIVGKWEKQ